MSLVSCAAFVLLDGISIKELGCVFVVSLIVAGSSAGIVSCSNTIDQEMLNGTIVGKQKNTVSCTHSYSCHCHQVCSGSKNRSCSQQCDTCYVHSHDYDWDVYTTIRTITIDRIDSQGSTEPARWSIVHPGDPIVESHSYTNYIKASPGTLFRHQGSKEKYENSLPEYPSKIYDYYRLNRLVTVGVSVDDPTLWNEDLTIINSRLGSAKQVNIVLVLVRNKPEDWYYALEESWIGGKKNDAILVVDVDDQLKPQWAQVMAWTSNEYFKVKLRDDVMGLPTITREGVVGTLRDDVEKQYVRKPMKDFEYLSTSIIPSTFQWFITLFIALMVSGGLLAFFQIHDVFGDE